MISERHSNETVPNRPTSNAAPPPPSYNEASSGLSSQMYDTSADGTSYFLGEVTVNLSFAFSRH